MPLVTGRMRDVARRAAHLSHEARVVKSLAEDAIEDGVHAARRAVKSVRRGIESLEDVRDEWIHSVKRRPLKAVTVAAGTGFVIGVAAAWIARRFKTELTSSD
jgi:ElaB/YqjD/DUF883 family membrane-anchored ribosome-binding protein